MARQRKTDDSTIRPEAHILRELFHEHSGNHTVNEAALEAYQRLGPTPIIKAMQRLVKTVKGLIEDNKRLRSELAKTKEQLAEAQKEARVDPLTGLANRRGFKEHMKKAQEVLKRHAVDKAEHGDAVGDGPRYCIAYIDLNNFKPLNDKHGHDAGDEALKSFVSKIDEISRPYNITSRLGGDEFAVLISIDEDDNIQQAQQRYRRELASTQIEITVKDDDGREQKISWALGASIGFYDLDKDNDPDFLLDKADREMMAQKHKTPGSRRELAGP